MKQEKLKIYRDKLVAEKDRVHKLMEKMKENRVSDMYDEMDQELSTFDNHPGDLGTIRSDIERGAYIKDNEISILRKVDEALHAIDENTYGFCKECGKTISEERLDLIPYATTCVNCQTN
ncbi:TraR/DksA C4-type zinc finger protein [Alkalibaculum sporogenes]|uniref:TraR/DksA C4-type zinc finger protein n=1 Tax=Alkalibaculum sporogenes TaxID=2655001 RepID=UPI00187B7FD0